MRSAALISLVATITILALVKVVPFLGATVPIFESTPGPQSLGPATELKLLAGRTLCVGNVALGPQSKFAAFTMPPGAATRSPVILSATGATRPTPVLIPVGSPTVTGRLKPPSSDRLASVCIRNKGPRSVVLLAAPPGRESTIAETRIDGVLQESDASLAILRSEGSPRIDALPTAVSRAARFTVFPPFVLWLLGIAVVLVVPACLSAALWASFSGRYS